MADNIANTVALAKYAKVIGCSVSVMLCAIPRLTVPAFLTPGQTHLSYSASWATPCSSIYFWVGFLLNVQPNSQGGSAELHRSAASCKH
jgi:hypothetical protein